MPFDCAHCEKKVFYPTEGVKSGSKYWHKGCFKCRVCNLTLTLNTFFQINDSLYCKNHKLEASSLAKPKKKTTTEKNLVISNNPKPVEEKNFEDYGFAQGNILRLPNEMVLKIATELGSAQDMCNVLQSCSLFYFLLKGDKEVWKSIHGKYVFQINSEDVKKSFIQQYENSKNGTVELESDTRKFLVIPNEVVSDMKERLCKLFGISYTRPFKLSFCGKFLDPNLPLPQDVLNELRRGSRMRISVY